MTIITDFLDKIEEPQKSELFEIYKLIKNLVPNATETISYGMPVFKYNGKYLIGFSAFRNHMSIFPGSEVIEVIKNDLSEYKTSKGTIQFINKNKLPDQLIAKIIRLRIKDIEN